MVENRLAEDSSHSKAITGYNVGKLVQTPEALFAVDRCTAVRWK